MTLFFIFTLLFIMNLAIMPFSFVLSIINMLIIAVLAAITFFVMKNYENYLFNISKDIKNMIDEDEKSLINEVPSPVVILNSEEPYNMVFFNESFRKIFIDRSDSIDFFNNYSDVFSDIVKNKIGSITFNGKSFKVCSKKNSKFIVLYFTDITDYKILKKKYSDTRLCVGFIMFDNKDELYRYATDEQNSQISVAVEGMLREWILKSEGIFKKLSSGRYFIVFEERYLKKFISDKFKIIDKIHTARIDEHRYATVSIGISRGAENLRKAKDEAKNALDMSLGRGGDQVAVKGKTSYEFFGGTSQEIEKRSKVRTRVVASTLLEKIKSADSIFIMGHKYSDFDSIGASCALWGVCRHLKKNSFVVVNINDSMASAAISHIEKSTSNRVFISPSQAQSMITDNSLLIIADTHSLNFLESLDLYRMSNNIAVIDHHRLTVSKIDNAVIFYHEPSASSACEMVTELIQYMGDKYLNKYEAECLLAGIALDTKNFSLKAGVRTFEAAAYLRKKGADISEVKQMFAGSIESYRLKCRIIENAKVIDNCAVAWLDEYNKNSRMSCAQAADELLNVKNIKASFVLFRGENQINISARSLGDINVQTIMEALGGGAHQTMAATQMENVDIHQAEQKLIEAIKTNKLSIKGE